MVAAVTILAGPDSNSLLANQQRVKKCSFGGTEANVVSLKKAHPGRYYQARTNELSVITHTEKQTSSHITSSTVRRFVCPKQTEYLTFS